MIFIGYRVRPPTFYNYGTYIYQALGDYKKAEDGFNNLIAFYEDSTNEVALLDVLADAGSSKVKRGIRENLPNLQNEGIKQLQISFEKSQIHYFSTAHYIMIGKEYAKRLITIGDLSNAKNLLEGLLYEASTRKLIQQATVIRALYEEVNYFLGSKE